MLTLSSILAQFLKGKIVKVMMIQHCYHPFKSHKQNEWVSAISLPVYVIITQHLLAIKQNCRQSCLKNPFSLCSILCNKQGMYKEYILRTTSHFCNCFPMEDSVFHFVCVSVASWQPLEGIPPHLSAYRTCSSVIFK